MAISDITGLACIFFNKYIVKEQLYYIFKEYLDLLVDLNVDKYSESEIESI